MRTETKFEYGKERKRVKLGSQDDQGCERGKHMFVRNSGKGNRWFFWGRTEANFCHWRTEQTGEAKKIRFNRKVRRENKKKGKSKKTLPAWYYTLENEYEEEFVRKDKEKSPANGRKR